MPHSPNRNRADEVARLNDEMRDSIAAVGQTGRVLLTQGVTALSPTDQLRIIKGVKACKDFDRDNKEHDFGVIELNDQTYYWKIDCYDEDCEFGSEDATNPAITTRVLTIMRADEY